MGVVFGNDMTARAVARLPRDKRGRRSRMPGSGLAAPSKEDFPVEQRMNRSRSRLAAALLAGALAIGAGAGRLLAHDGPAADHADPVAVIKASQEMSQSAQNLWAALTPEQ